MNTRGNSHRTLRFHSICRSMIAGILLASIILQSIGYKGVTAAFVQDTSKGSLSSQGELIARVKEQFLIENEGTDFSLIFVSNIVEELPWAYGLVGARATEEQAEPLLVQFIAKYENETWTVSMEGSTTFSDWVWLVPDEVIKPEVKTVLAPQVSSQGNGVNQFSLPWNVGESWTLTGGPHSNGGLSGEVWSSLDFQGPNRIGQARAAREGIVSYSDSCPNFVLVTHPDGYKTGYYHLINISVQNGQSIVRGTVIGEISTAVGCGGKATGPHVHFSLRNSSNTKISIDGIDIGGWTVHNGSEEYNGSMVRIRDSLRVNQWGTIYNDGTIGSGSTGIPLPSDTTKCADENGTCTVPGTTTVYYGANDKYFYKNSVSGSIACNNATFGDPISGVGKSCYYKNINSGSNCPNYSYNGVVLFENKECNYSSGKKAEFSSEGPRNIPELDLNDQVSSIYVGPGWSAKVYEDYYGRGSWRCWSVSPFDLSKDLYENGNTGLNIDNTISSVEVFHNTSCSGSFWSQPFVYDYTRYNGASARYSSTGLWQLEGSTNFNDRPESIMLPYGWSARLYADNNRASPSVCLTGNDADLSNNNYDTNGSGGVSNSVTWIDLYDTSSCPALAVAPPAPTLTSPIPNETINRNSRISLAWQSIAGATYNIKFWGAMGTNIETGFISDNPYFVGDSLYAGTYNWQVQAKNSAGPGPWSEVRTLYIKYGTPGNLTVTSVSQGQINLSWSASADGPGNIDGYRVYRDGAAVNTIGGTQTAYSDTGLACGRTYNYTVKAYKDSSESDASNSVSATTPACAAGVPQLVSPNDDSEFSEGQAITLSWTRTGDTFFGEVWGGPGGTSTFGFQNENTKNIGSQWAGYTYSWHVLAHSSGGDSDYSATRKFTVRLAPPGALTVTSTCSQATLRWTDNSGSEQGYKVYRDGVVRATLGSNVTNYVDAITGGANYSYQVVAYRGDLESNATDQVLVSAPYCAPGNDNRASAWVVGALPYNSAEFTGGATLEAGEPEYKLVTNNSASVWYSFKPATLGQYTIDTLGSDYDTILHLFEKDASGNLTYLQGEDDAESTRQSKMIFTAKANVTYLISVTSYGSYAIGGNLSFHVKQVPCPTGNLCVTVTSPFYEPFWWGQVEVYQNGSRLKWADLDSYGYTSFSGISGTVSLYIHGDSMTAEMPTVTAPGVATFTGVGLPSVSMELKDGTGQPVGAFFEMGGKYPHGYVGNSSASDPKRLVYATPGTYEWVAISSSAKIMAVTNMVVLPDMNASEMVYDISTSPARTFTYHLSTIPSLYAVFWTPYYYGWSIKVTDGTTLTISMPGDTSYYMENVVEIDDSSGTGYWQYTLPKGMVKVTRFREGEDVTIGGNLRIQPTAYNSPFGPGDTAAINYRLADGYNNTILDMLFYSTSGAAAAQSDPLPASDKPGTHPTPTRDPGQWRQDENARLAPFRPEVVMSAQEVTPITRQLQIQNPSGALMASDSLADNSGYYEYPLTGASPLGIWTAKVSVNHLGSWPSQDGLTEFTVKDTPAPSNDNFEAPHPVGVTPFSETLDTFGATQSDDDPDLSRCASDRALASVWYRYDAAQDGVITVDTVGSDYDTIIGVWTGTRGDLSMVGCNDDRVIDPRDQDSELVATVNAGVTYYIMAGRWQQMSSTSTAIGADKHEEISAQTAGGGVLQMHVRFSNSLPVKPSLVSPTGTIVTRSTTFSWNKVGFGVNYTLRVMASGGVEVYRQTLSAMDACQGTNCWADVPFQFANGSYQWQLQAANISGVGPWSDPMSFSVLSAEPVDCYDLNLAVTPAGAGKVTRSPDFNCNAGHQYISGSSLTLEAEANPGYDFVAWLGAVTGSQPFGQVAITSHTSITAQFQYRVPSLDSLSPTEVETGSPLLTLTINGSDFTSASKVRWNGTDLATTFVSSTKLTAQVPVANLLTAGAYTISVTNPAPGGGISDGLAFTVKNAMPALNSITPATAMIGGSGATLTVSGNGFFSGSKVRWNTTDLTTTYNSKTQLTASIPATLLATAGVYSITVFNPAPGGGTSASLDFTISNPVPVLTSLSPSPAAVGSAFTLTANGSNFGKTAVIRWNGTDLATTYVSNLKLTAQVPANLVATAGTISIKVFNPAPGGGESSVLGLSVNNPLPILTRLSPANALVGSDGFTMSLTGSGFVSSSTVQWNGANLTTTFNSSTALTAEVPASLLSAASTVQVTVTSQAPGGGKSGVQTFTVQNPKPLVVNLAPGQALTGGTDFTLTINGSLFKPGVVVSWDTMPLATTFVSDTQLTALVPAVASAQAREVAVTVANPTPNAGKSDPFTFSLTNPMPEAGALNPAKVTAGAASLTLCVSGQKFSYGALLDWSGERLTPTSISATSLCASIPAARLATGKIVPVAVFNPAPGGGLSNALELTIANPLPVITSISPAMTSAGSGKFTLSVSGSGFNPASQILWNGQPLATTYFTPTLLRTSVQPDMIAAVGVYQVGVRNPSPGGGLSAELKLTGVNALPINGSRVSTLRPIFDWDNVAKATSYELQVCSSPSFLSLKIGAKPTASGYSPTISLTPNARYYWRVRPIYGTVPGAWLFTFSFTTGNPPGIPALALPVNGSLTTDLTPRLDWQNATVPSGTTLDHYQVQVATSSRFTSFVYERNVAASEFTPESNLAANSVYYWRVRAFNKDGQSSLWSSTWSFRTALNTPLLISPMDDEVLQTNRPLMDWEDTPGAAGYTIQLSTSPTFATLAANLVSKVSQVMPAADLPGGKVIYWRVQATGTNGPSLWSVVNSFTTGMPPGVPTLLKPASGSLQTSYQPLLDWKDVSLPLGTTLAYYEIQISNQASFATSLVDEQAGQSQYQPSAPLEPNKTYYWRVRSFNSSSEYSAWSAVWSFRTAIPQPVLLYPIGGESVPLIRPVFDWEDAPGATGYTLQLSTSTSFLLPFASLATKTSSGTLAKDLPSGKVIYWRVRASGPYGPSLWSVTGSFRTARPPSVPVLLKPASGTLQTSYQPLLDWANVTLPTGTVLGYYEIQIASEARFTSPLVDAQVSVSQYKPVAPLDPSKTYYWRVRAYNTRAEYSAWSATWSFRTVIVPPALTNPTNGETILLLRPVFDWQDSAGATGYTLQVSLTSSFATPLASLTTKTSIGALSVDLPAGRVIYWRVRATGSNGPSAWTAASSFTTGKPPTVPVLRSPANASLQTGYQPLLDWNDSILTTGTSLGSYQIQVSSDARFTTPLIDEQVGVSQYQPASPLDANQAYYWRVRAFNNLGAYSAWSAVWSFRAAITQPVLVSPANGESVFTLRPAFDWDDVPGASGYTVQLSLSTSFATPIASLIVSKSSGVLSAELPAAKQIYWRVQASGINGPSLWSDTYSFTTPNPPPVPLLLGPTNGSLQIDYQPLLDWTDVTPPVGITLSTYQVQVSKDASFTAPLIDEQVGVSQYQPASPLDANQVYYWRVRASNSLGAWSGWSPVWSFRAAILTPSPVSPTDGASIPNVRPAFDWEDTPGASGYNLELSLANTFTNPLVILTCKDSAGTLSADLPAGRVIYWRVQAAGSNGPSLWSATNSFTTGMPPAVPLLSLPVNGTILYTRLPLLDWYDTTLPIGTTLDHYQIQVASDAAFRVTLVDETSPISQFQVSGELPANNTLYWRVRAFNGSSEYSAWSSVWSFKTLPAAPTLISPDDQASLSTTRPTFDWDDTPGAISYTILVSTSSTFSDTLVSQSVTASTLTLSFDLPTGQPLYWKVLVKTANGISPWSEKRTVTLGVQQ